MDDYGDFIMSEVILSMGMESITFLYFLASFEEILVIR